jgi:hypothetical protein
MPLSERLKKLSQVRSVDTPILSLYLHYSHREARERERIRIFLKNSLKKISAHPRQNALARDFKAAQDYLANALKPQTHGIALFACGAAGLFEAYQFWIPLLDQFALGPAPTIHQLVRAIDDYETTLLVLADSESARSFLITPEAVLQEVLSGGEAPARPKRGFWNQAGFQRHVEGHMARHHKLVAEEIAALWDREHFTNIILSGQDRVLASFQALLPKRVQERVIGTLKLSVHAKDEAILEEAVHVIRRVEEEKARKERHKMEHAGMLVSGWDDLAAAANAGRILNLYIRAGAKKDGWHCASCDLLGSGKTVRCALCGGGVQGLDLAEALVQKVEKDGGRIDVSLQMDPDVSGALRF